MRINRRKGCETKQISIKCTKCFANKMYKENSVQYSLCCPHLRSVHKSVACSLNIVVSNIELYHSSLMFAQNLNIIMNTWFSNIPTPEPMVLHFIISSRYSQLKSHDDGQNVNKTNYFVKLKFFFI